MPRLEKLRPQPDERLAFLQVFLRKPQQVGSVIPSSRFLERKLVELTGVANARVVVELGPGTGGTTRALLNALPADATLLAIEIDPRFAAILRETREPRLIVHEGSAEALSAVLRQHGLGAPDVVVSGIPFSTMEPALASRIAASIHEALPAGGRFVAYQVRDPCTTWRGRTSAARASRWSSATSRRCGSSAGGRASRSSARGSV
jgi:phospholipid N-methyltransferase